MLKHQIFNKHYHFGHIYRYNKNKIREEKSKNVKPQFHGNRTGQNSISIWDKNWVYLASINYFQDRYLAAWYQVST